MTDTDTLRAENAALRAGMRALVNHKAGEEPNNDVVEAFQILEDETNDRNRLAREVFTLTLRAEQAERERDEARAALADYRDHGTRHDIMPTHRLGDEAFWHDYLLRIDRSIRERARIALGEA